MKKWLKWLLIIVGILIVLVIIAFVIRYILMVSYNYSGPDLGVPGITNFEECVDAGGEIMESYPRQCKDPIKGKTFVEVVE